MVMYIHLGRTRKFYITRLIPSENAPDASCDHSSRTGITCLRKEVHQNCTMNFFLKSDHSCCHVRQLAKKKLHLFICFRSESNRFGSVLLSGKHFIIRIMADLVKIAPVILFAFFMAFTLRDLFLSQNYTDVSNKEIPNVNLGPGKYAGPTLTILYW